MAKIKKKGLTLEEKLKQALVPEEEWPYEVPRNWVWTKVINLRKDEESFFDGDWILSKNMENDGSVRLIQLSDIGIGEFLNKSSKYISEETYNELKCSRLFEGDVLISRMAEPIARSCIMPQLPYICITAVDVAVMRCNTKIVLNKYFNFLCNTNWFSDLALKLARGTTRVRITRKSLGNMPVPLPPLSEQQRIVDRIESLFAKLDQAKALVKNALDTFESHKAAILHKAFTGELTAKWREKNGVGMESWEEKRLGECGKWFGGGTPSKINELFWKNGDILWVTPKDMKSIIITDTIDKITYEAIGGSSANLIEKPAILFVVRSGILRRIMPIAMSTQPVTINQDMKALIPDDDIVLTYLCWFCISRERDIREKCLKSGTTVESINTESLYSYMAKIPSLSEQREIVRILGSLFEKEQKAKELYDVIEKIDLMKKAILARAFRGELGTNDPNEESAVELLKEVLKDK